MRAFNKRLWTMVAAFLLAIGLGLVIPSAAHAVTACTDWTAWKVASGGWGQWRYCTSPDPGGWDHWRFQVDDTATDGYAVHLEMYDWQLGSGFAPHTWNDLGNSCFTCEDMNSAGPVATSAWPAFYDLGGGNHTVRLVRGRADGAGTHQSITIANWIVSSGL